MKNPARKESLQHSAFRRQHAVVHVSAIMHILPGYRGTFIRGGGGGGCIFGALQLTSYFSKKGRVLIFGGVLIYGVLWYLAYLLSRPERAFNVATVGNRADYWGLHGTVGEVTTQLSSLKPADLPKTLPFPS